MAYRHGVYASEVPTSIIPPVQTEAGLPVIVGTAPIHLGSSTEAMSNINKPQLIYSYDEAVSLFGFSRDWKKYTLCEFIYSQFALFAVSPCVLINVLDPNTHKQKITDRGYSITDGEVNLGTEVIITSGFEAASITAAEEGSGYTRTIYTENTDYSLGYDTDGNAIFTVIETGALANAANVYLSFTKLDPSQVDAYDIIGGVDAQTEEYTGFELVNRVFPKFRLVPGLLGSPYWSTKPEVAAVMRAKARLYNKLCKRKNRRIKLWNKCVKKR